MLRVLAHTFLSVSMCRAVVTCLQCSLPLTVTVVLVVILVAAAGLGSPCRRRFCA